MTVRGLDIALATGEPNGDGLEAVRVAVIFGGRSSEREVSLASGRQVYLQLDRARYAGVPVFMDAGGSLWRVPDKLVIQNTCHDVEARLEREAQSLTFEDLPEIADVAFIALHGKYGDDGCVQGMLELLDLPYSGSGVLACAASMDKPTAHALLAAAGLEVPRAVVVDRRAWEADPELCVGNVVWSMLSAGVGERSYDESAVGRSPVTAATVAETTLMGGSAVNPTHVSATEAEGENSAGLRAIEDGRAESPDRSADRLVVLPAREGSSVGVSVVDTPADLAPAIDAAMRFDDRVLVEEFLDGMEFSVIVLAPADADGKPEALLPTETVSRNAFMTYDDKYMPGRSQKITPARVDSGTLHRIQADACRVYDAMGFEGYARLDGFLLEDGRILFTDPNPTSGMSPSSFLFHQAAEAGMTASAVIDRILTAALRVHRDKRGPL